ncbi:hypothetical protein [Streptomyces zaomyceticus]|uniref:hypothetical protein n=1 Tax=Streptomyces zaomyceticus TaxID=68286 RepID=UPI003419C6E7
MTSDARRARPLQHVTATGTALAVALAPVVLGALIARSVGGDPMASVNALIAGGGQRARISPAQLRTGALRRPGSVARLAGQEEGPRRALLGVRFPHHARRLDETGGRQRLRDMVR